VAAGTVREDEMKRTAIWLAVSLALLAALASTVGVVSAAKGVKPPKRFDTVPANSIYIEGNNWWAGGDTNLSGGAPVLLTELTASSIAVGTTVTWTNYDSNHDVHIHDHDTGAMVGASPRLRRGDSWSLTFSTAGTFSFHCSIHSSMEHVELTVQ
jgi:plastocyanin